MIYNLVEDNFGAGRQVLGSLIFLRFICPAIISPTRYNLADGENFFQLLSFFSPLFLIYFFFLSF